MELLRPEILSPGDDGWAGQMSALAYKKSGLASSLIRRAKSYKKVKIVI